MESWFQQSLGSYKFWIFIGALAFFLYAVYFAVYGLSFSVGLISDHYVFDQVSKDPWWWAVLYYGSEGVVGFLCGFFRAIAGFFAVSAAFLFWRKKDAGLSSIKSIVTKALFFEAAYFISLSLSVVASLVYFFSGDQFYYFDGLPGLIYVLVAGLPLLAMIVFVAPTLLKLRKKILQDAGGKEITRWACLAGVAYLFVVFWFNYSMSWAGVLVTYPRVNYGLSFLLSSTNLVSFSLTFFGLLLLAFYGLIISLPVIQKKSIHFSPKRIGALLSLLGGYFLFNVFFYYSTGGYEANPSVWYEVIGPLHNPYFWCFTLFFLGLVTILRPTLSEK